VRVLAIDHGEARCGLAICDATQTIVRPLKAVAPDVAEIARIAKEERIGQIVVGLPLSMDGTEGAQAAVVRGFSGELEGAVGLPIELLDERLTTTMAAASRREGAGADEDSLAAAHLLEHWLAAHENSAPSDGPVGDQA
jgi:putative holliday junction resolvase